MPVGNILVADDDAAIRTVLNQALSRAGYEVRSTGNAATLWRWISQGDGDLIISDVLLPDESAFDLLPRIKKARPDLPIIVMSAQNTFMTAIRASERGAYEYLPKPFDLKEFQDRMPADILARVQEKFRDGDECILIPGKEPMRVIVNRVGEWKSKAPELESSPGELIDFIHGGLGVECGCHPSQAILEILELQPAGKKRMTAEEFLRGHPLREGDRFGPEAP